MSQRVARSVRVYRRLLSFYSPEFRSRFGEEMVAVFAACCERADVAGRRSALMIVWLDVVRDLVVSSIADRAGWIGVGLWTWPMRARARPATAAKHFVFATLSMLAVGKMIVPGPTRRAMVVPAPGPGAPSLLLDTLCIAAALYLVLRCVTLLEPLLRTVHSDPSRVQRR